MSLYLFIGVIGRGGIPHFELSLETEVLTTVLRFLVPN